MFQTCSKHVPNMFNEEIHCWQNEFDVALRSLNRTTEASEVAACNPGHAIAQRSSPNCCEENLEVTCKRRNRSHNITCVILCHLMSSYVNMSRYLSRYVENRVATSFTGLNLWFKHTLILRITSHLSQHSQHMSAWTWFLHISSTPWFVSPSSQPSMRRWSKWLRRQPATRPQRNFKARHGMARTAKWSHLTRCVRKWYENGTLRLQLEQMSPIRWLLPLSGIQLVEHHKEPGRKHAFGAVAWSLENVVFVPFRASLLCDLQRRGWCNSDPKTFKDFEWKNSERTLKEPWGKTCNIFGKPGKPGENTATPWKMGGWDEKTWKNIALLCLATYVIVKPLWLKPRSPSALQPPKIRKEIRKEGAAVHSLDPHKQNALEWYNMIQHDTTNGCCNMRNKQSTGYSVLFGRHADQAILVNSSAQGNSCLVQVQGLVRR